MKMRKILVSLLAVLMVFSCMNLTAFADDDEWEEELEMYDFMADMWLSNGDCVEKDALEAVEAVVITKDADPSVSITVPATYDAEWESIEAYKDFEDNDPEKAAYETILADASAAQIELYEKIIGELGDLLSPKALKTKLDAAAEDDILDMNLLKGYTISMPGLESDHYQFEIMAEVIDRATAIYEFEVSAELMLQLAEITVGEGGDIAAYPETYTELFDILAQFGEPSYESYEEMLKAQELPDDFIAEELDALKEMDTDLANAKDETIDYPASLWVDVDLVCECPEMMEYEIQHHYYKIVDGKLQPVPEIVVEGDQYDEWFDYRYFLGEEGTEISAKDFMKPVYGDVEYEYVGSYDIDAMWMYEEEPYTAYDEEYKLDSYELGDYCDGLILVYVAEETTDKTTSVDVPADDADEPSDNEPAPPTGDRQPVGLYVGLLVVAVAAAGGLFVYKKKKR